MSFITILSNFLLEKILSRLSHFWKNKNTLNILLKIHKKETKNSIGNSFVVIDLNPDGLYLIVEIINNSNEPIRIISLLNEKNKILTEFSENGLTGYALQPAKNYSNNVFLDDNKIQLIKKSKKFFIKDSSQKYYCLSKENKKNFKKSISEQLK